jgi:hypothetical protein
MYLVNKYVGHENVTTLDVGGLQIVDCQRVAKLEEFGSSIGFQNLFHLFFTQMQVHLQRDCLERAIFISLLSY